MSDNRITQFLANVQDPKQRNTLRLGIHYRKKKGYTAEQLLQWLEENSVGVVDNKSLKEGKTKSEFTEEQVKSVIKEMEQLQESVTSTSAFSKQDAVVIEMRPKIRSLEKTKNETEEQDKDLPNTALIIKAVVLSGIIIAATYYLVSATTIIYGVLAAVLLEIMPLAFIFSIRNRILKIILSMAFGVCGVMTLLATHSVEISNAKSIALDTNPEYQRVSLKLKGMQENIDNLSAGKYITKRAALREDMQLESDKLSAMELAAKGGQDSESTKLTSDVKFIVRILLYIGSLALSNALSVTVSQLNFPRLRRRVVSACK